MDFILLSFSWALERGGGWLALKWFFTWSWSKKQKVSCSFRAWSRSPTGRSRSAALWPVSRWMACKNLSGFPWWWAAWVPGSCLQASWHWRRDFWLSLLLFLQSGGLLDKWVNINTTECTKQHTVKTVKYIFDLCSCCFLQNCCKSEVEENRCQNIWLAVGTF